MSSHVEALLEHQSGVIDLLARDASHSELQGALAAVRATASEPGLAAVSDRFAEAIIRLHRSRTEDQRRTAGLSALIETVTDLATHRDVDMLLRAICRRARGLLSTDVAYLMLTDPAAGDSYVHTTDGIVSQAFRTMRVAAGVGICGRVAATAEPETTPDYGADARLRHSVDVDGRVSEEGLRGVAAAPMRRGGEVMGVLFACSRTTRRFAAREVALLAALADHAAVAIDNARLLRDARQAADHLADAEARARSHADHVEKVARARDHLAALALDGAELPELLEGVLRFVPGSLEAVVPQARARHLRRSVGADAGSRPAAFEVNISAGPERLGCLRLHRNQADGTEQEILDYTAGLAANVLLRHQARSEAELRGLARILEGAVEGRAEKDDLDRLLGRMGVSADEPLVVLAWTAPSTRARWAWLQVARTAAGQRSLAANVGGHIIVVAPGHDADRTAQEWHARLRATHPGDEALTVGAAASPGARGLQEATGRALRVIGLLTALDRSGTAAGAEQLGILGHLLDAGARPNLALFVEQTLTPLDDYDATARAALTPVVEAFFAQDGHLARTAEALHVHINTLYRRLKRADALLGPGWRSGDQRLELTLALRLRTLERGLEERGSQPTSR